MNNAFSLNQKRKSRPNDSTAAIEVKLQRKKEIDEYRRERHRVQAEEFRVKRLEDQQNKVSNDKTYFSKTMEKDRRSWILGMGIKPLTDDKPRHSPKTDLKRQQYNKAMRRLETSGRLSAESDSLKTSSTPESSSAVHLPYERHSAIYHSSQFQVSDLTCKKKSIVNSEIDSSSAACRICQSEEDSLKNQLVTPCSCSGSLQYVHHLCLQQWRKTKRASGADVLKCELCLKNYDTELLGKTDVKPDQTKKMQEDLRRIVRSGVYLMLLVDFCRDSFQDLLRERPVGADANTSTTSVAIHPPSTVTSTATLRRDSVYTPCDEEGNADSSEDNEEYVSRAQVKQRSLNLDKF